MKKMLIVILSLLLSAVPALADPDLAAMTTIELTQLRLSIDRELASRAGADQEQVINMDGILVTFDHAEICTANAFEDGSFFDAPAIVFFIRVSNTTEKDFLVNSSIKCQAVLDGALMNELVVNTDKAHLQDGSIFRPNIYKFTTVRPGEIGLLLGFGFFLPEGSSGTVDLQLIHNYASGYCGSFAIDLSAL